MVGLAKLVVAVVVEIAITGVMTMVLVLAMEMVETSNHSIWYSVDDSVSENGNENQQNGYNCY